jgi:uncharacterized protein YegJ (DUF2314 family)
VSTRTFFLCIAAAVLAVGPTGCKKPVAKPQVDTDTVSAGDVRADTAFYSVVFYYTPDPATDPGALAKSLADQFLQVPSIETDPANQPEELAPYIGFEEEMAPLKRFPVPDAEYFEHAGHGLAPEEIQAIQKTSRATRLVFVMPKEAVWIMGRTFTELTLEFAKQTGAFIWDSATRECFSQAAWKERRLDSWPAEFVPAMERQITIHVYRPEENSEYLRAITLGMEKFALPDVVIEQMISSDSRSAGNLINLVCQSLAERPQLVSGSKEAFRISDIYMPSVREKLSRNLKAGATQEAILALVKGALKEGDPENRLIELDFRHGAGQTVDERRESVLASIWGASDSITDVEHSPEILAASSRAKAKLPDLQKSFQAGLEPGSHLMLKGPFKTDNGGNEWMWVEVLRWPEGGPIEGSLQNDPFRIKGLRAGARVKVNQGEVFDYMLYRKDGTQEGNETGDLIEKQSGRVREK